MIIIKKPYYFEILFLFILIIYGCSNENDEIEEIDKAFVTKKSASMYSHPKKRNPIDEIPAFVNLKSSKKMSIKRAAGMKTTYFEVSFNNKKGWVSAIYLAEIKNNDKNLSEKSSSNKKSNLSEKSSSNKKSNLSEKSSSNKKSNLSEKKPVDKDFNYPYSVQIGSFKDRDFASTLVKKTKKLGFDSRLEKFNGDSGNWYRVRVGKYKNKKEATESVNKIRIKFPSEPWVVEPSNNGKIKKRKIKNELTQYYTVQIKSFKDYNKAKQFSNSISKIIKENIITPININNQKWYRVHTQDLKTISKAKNLSEKINEDLKIKSWISNTYK